MLLKSLMDMPLTVTELHIRQYHNGMKWKRRKKRERKTTRERGKGKGDNGGKVEKGQ